LPPLRRELAQIEERIAALAAERSRLEAQACEEAGYGKLTDPARERVARDAAALEARWLEIASAIEAAERRTVDTR
jgi:ATP-binding cassette subfamily F protein 3